LGEGFLGGAHETEWNALKRRKTLCGRNDHEPKERVRARVNGGGSGYGAYVLGK